MNNFEFHMWAAHVGHDVNVIRYTWSGHDQISIACDTCKSTIEVWEFIPEYENGEK